MPFKNVKCKMYNVRSPFQLEKGIINLWTPYDNKTYLTDVYAFEQAFVRLNIDDDVKIVLLGTGAMAKTVIQLLPRNDIYVLGRDEEKVALLMSNFGDKNIVYDGTICLINTTPLGMNDENVLDAFPVKVFHMAIDLPYQNKKTKLVEHCEDKNIPIIDGIEFWNLQAQKQLEVFVENISNEEYS
jgi:shikimate 5-dehydrogenase